MIVFLFLFLFYAALIGFIWWSKSREKRKHSEGQHKLSDAELFKMMTQANHFLTAEQLTAVSTLTIKEAKARLMYLATNKIIYRYLNLNGSGKSIYQLKEDVPLISSVRTNLNELSEQEIIDVILLHVDDYQITIAELVVIFGVDIYEAKALIKRLRKQGMISVLRKKFTHIYVVKQSIRQQKPNLRIKDRKKSTGKMEIPIQERLRIPDSEIIQLAIDNKGKLTPTLLCLRKNISIDEAKYQLEDLYEQGAFVIDVDEDNCVMEYHLRDKSLL